MALVNTLVVLAAVFAASDGRITPLQSSISNGQPIGGATASRHSSLRLPSIGSIANTVQVFVHSLFGYGRSTSSNHYSAIGGQSRQTYRDVTAAALIGKKPKEERKTQFEKWASGVPGAMKPYSNYTDPYWTPSDQIEVCPGESDRHGDHKCNHHNFENQYGLKIPYKMAAGQHRLCMQLLEPNGTPLRWEGKRWIAPFIEDPGKPPVEKLDYWQLLGYDWDALRWDKKMRKGPNKGDSWCINTWDFPRLVKKVGCENVNVRCAASDLIYLFRSYSVAKADPPAYSYGQGAELESWEETINPADECLRQKCDPLGKFAPSVELRPIRLISSRYDGWVHFVGITVASLAGAVFARVASLRRTPPASVKPMLG